MIVSFEILRCSNSSPSTETVVAESTGRNNKEWPQLTMIAGYAHKHDLHDDIGDDQGRSDPNCYVGVLLGCTRRLFGSLSISGCDSWTTIDRFQNGHYADTPTTTYRGEYRLAQEVIGWIFQRGRLNVHHGWLLIDHLLWYIVKRQESRPSDPSVYGGGWSIALVTEVGADGPADPSPGSLKNIKFKIDEWSYSKFNLFPKWVLYGNLINWILV